MYIYHTGGDLRFRLVTKTKEAAKHRKQEFFIEESELQFHIRCVVLALSVSV